ncbi:MAG TPA: Ni/Fe hydrogenase subunit alpha [Candidatus Dormibacteraeota bacterium]|nr:Ni/Fe hydrogenase subunit alpha [Candidatus Dormibacteraeota bacterium]
MDATDGAAGTTETRFRVGYITRVEGEGSLTLSVRDGEVVEARLGIFEAPRYFEQLVVGRTPDEVIDIVARICGICPIAYQMSAVHAFESGFGIQVEPATRALRRLLYCGEWIQSHALHIYLLHVPDFLGYPSALAMAADHRDLVAQGLALKRIGNELITAIGGRPVHPVSVRVGGFSRAPRRPALRALRPRLDDAVRMAQATVDAVAALPGLPFEREALLVSLRHPDEYPYNHGRIVSSEGLDVAATDWDEAFEELHVEGSNALHARTRDGRPYLLGPSARVTLAGDRLHPLAAEALERTGLREAIRTNIHWSIAARAIELLHATAEACDLIDAYEPPSQPKVAWEARPGRCAWATEAPRGLLFHRYEIDERGRVAEARIVPPTSQNQGHIEKDLALFAPSVLALPHDEATRRLEQLVRAYDPCISCATHFLDLRIEDRTGR